MNDNTPRIDTFNNGKILQGCHAQNYHRIFECKVFDSQGKLIKIISREEVKAHIDRNLIQRKGGFVQATGKSDADRVR